MTFAGEARDRSHTPPRAPLRAGPACGAADEASGIPLTQSGRGAAAPAVVPETPENDRQREKCPGGDGHDERNQRSAIDRSVHRFN